MPFRPQKILAATDFSTCSQHAVDAAVDLANSFHASLTLIHVIPLSTYLDFAAGIEGQTIASLDYQAAVRSAVKQSWRDEEDRLRNRGASIQTVTREGQPALEVSAFAKEGGFDLVVIGTHGRTGLKHVLLGSVAEGVVRHCLPPVLTVRGMTTG